MREETLEMVRNTLTPDSNRMHGEEIKMRYDTVRYILNNDEPEGEGWNELPAAVQMVLLNHYNTLQKQEAAKRTAALPSGRRVLLTVYMDGQHWKDFDTPTRWLRSGQAWHYLSDGLFVSDKLSLDEWGKLIEAHKEKFSGARK